MIEQFGALFTQTWPLWAWGPAGANSLLPSLYYTRRHIFLQFWISRQNPSNLVSHSGRFLSQLKSSSFAEEGVQLLILGVHWCHSFYLHWEDALLVVNPPEENIENFAQKDAVNLPESSRSWWSFVCCYVGETWKQVKLVQESLPRWTDWLHLKTSCHQVSLKSKFFKA